MKPNVSGTLCPEWEEGEIENEAYNGKISAASRRHPRAEDVVHHLRPHAQVLLRDPDLLQQLQPAAERHEPDPRGSRRLQGQPESPARDAGQAGHRGRVATAVAADERPLNPDLAS